MLSRPRPKAYLAAAAVAALLAAAPLGGCGESSDSGAGDLARQRELAEARKQAAQDARQSATIERLEEKVNRLKDGEEGGRVSGEAPSNTAATTPVQEPAPSGLGDWPGGSGYSAMIGAFSSEGNARTRQREASELGLDAGVLYSSNFSSLRPGYWVVFSGTFDSQEEAAARAARARELGYSDSYPRFVSP